MFIDYCILIALGASFAITLLNKWGLRESVIVRAPKLLSDMFSCDFCLCFWASVLLSLLVAMWTGDFLILAAPFFSTPLARILL